MPRAQQGSAGHIPNASRFDNDRTGDTACEALIPFQHFGRYESVLAGTPGNHGGYPSPLKEVQRACVERGKKTRCCRCLRGWPRTLSRVVTDALRGAPHHRSGTTAVASISTFACDSIRATTCTT